MAARDDSEALAKSKVPRPPAWVTWWLVVGSLIVCWDAGYVLLRPHSMAGGALAAIWAPYALYGEWDHLYGRPGYEKYLRGEEGWNPTQSVLNLFEVALAGWYLVLLAGKRHGAASLVAILVSALTAYKTVAYFLIDGFTGWRNSSHLVGSAFWTSYVLPSSFWIVIPIAVVFKLWPAVLRRLQAV